MDAHRDITVVHLEDDPLDGELVANALGGLDGTIRIRRVLTRAEFLAAIHMPDVGLVLSDFRVPGFAGDHALALSLQARPDVPFLFVSGAIGEDLAIDLVKRGATDYVLKDRLFRLVPAVERALLESRERVERRRAEAALRFLSEASAALAATLDPDVSLPILARLAIRDAFAAVAVDLFEPSGARRAAEALRNDWRGALPLPSGDGASEDGAESGGILRLLLPGRSEALGRLIVAGAGCGLDDRDRLLAREVAVRIGSAIENARLFQQTRNAMRVRQELLAVVAHDLRNPLAAVMSATSVLERQAGASDDSKRWIQTVRRSVSRMENLIRDLLDLAAIEADRLRIAPSRHCVAGLVAESIDLFRSIASERGVLLESSCDPSLDVECDRERVLQVLSNLIGNALKFTKSRVRIVVAGGENVEISVEDDGLGIAPGQLPHLFERYWSADRERRGVGLGLAIVKGLVEAHGGRVAVDSVPGEGARFRVTLPHRFASERTAIRSVALR